MYLWMHKTYTQAIYVLKVALLFCKVYQRYGSKVSKEKERHDGVYTL